MSNINLPTDAGEYEVTTETGKHVLTFQPITQRWYLNGLEVGTGQTLNVPQQIVSFTAKAPAAAPKKA